MDKQREMSKVNMDGLMYCSRFGDHEAWIVISRLRWQRDQDGSAEAFQRRDCRRRQSGRQLRAVEENYIHVLNTVQTQTIP